MIVVDGGSTDSTESIVKTFPQTTFLTSPQKGMTHQRNYGFENAKGKYILSLDADMRIHKDLIKECVSVSEEKEKIVGVYVPEIILGDSPFHKIRRFERSFYNGTSIDAVRFFRKKTAEHIGFFDAIVIYIIQVLNSSASG